MAENCTIYCKINNLVEVAQLIHGHFPEIPANTISDETTPIVIDVDNGSLRVTPKYFHERGDTFCRLLLSTCAFIDGTSDADRTTKKSLVSHVASCELILGVVADPAFDSDERFHAVVFAIATALLGVIFNGHEMLDANGATLVASA